jgi:peptidoglycan/xylan/chitin deacetylase (PgdA/CDA1 family)
VKSEIIKAISSSSSISSYFTGLGTIFMLHRVDEFDQAKLSPNENMKVSPKFLDNFITELKSDGYDIISLDRLYEILVNGESLKKQILFTLDDGYKDNYTNAYPIFKKHNIPFTIYLTTSFPDKNALLWWYKLEELIVKCNDSIIIANNIKFECKDYLSKVDTFMKIRSIILKLDQKRLDIELDELFRKYNIEWFDINDKLCMSWSDIEELAKDTLVTIAGHTKNHYSLSRLNREEVLDEIIDANSTIRRYIGKDVDHFAYPFGGHLEATKREFDILKELNLKSATTTKRGNIFSSHRDHLHSLPRVMLTENFDIRTLGHIRRKRVIV